MCEEGGEGMVRQDHPLEPLGAEAVGYRIPVGIYGSHPPPNQVVTAGRWQLSSSKGCYRFSPLPRQDGTQADPEALSLGDYHSGELPLPILPTPRRLGNNRSLNAARYVIGFLQPGRRQTFHHCREARNCRAGTSDPRTGRPAIRVVATRSWPRSLLRGRQEKRKGKLCLLCW